MSNSHERTPAATTTRPRVSSRFARRCEAAHCRSCERVGLRPVLDLGEMPLSDGFLHSDQLDRAEPRYPLEVAFCPGCALVQILETVPPEELFCEDYPYFSSFSDTLLAHSRENALELIADRRLDANSLVVELASNDGYLLRNFVEHGVPVLGIDPAPGPAKAAEQVGVPTLNDFFTLDLARKLAAEGRRADVILANNVLAHVADTNGFVAGIGELLKPDGVAVIEVPYLRDLIDHCEFDTIYHEHLCYFSVTALDHLFRRHGLHLNRVRRLPIHGGSLRLYVQHEQRVEDSVRALLADEHRDGLDAPRYYEDFAARVASIGERLHELIAGLKRDGKRIYAYGAAAKGTIMLNYARLDHTLIDCALDRNVHKQGRTIPGVRIPIVAPERLLADMPDYTLLLVWNLKDEILNAQRDYIERGGRFIVPIPEPEIL
ncbi:MAG: class I SAM-dependent methyltransferase [Planctomycetota bacterium]|nr:MAG: class I SAM-dependent methyltransferase [Planctomycetota bacterium]